MDEIRDVVIICGLIGLTGVGLIGVLVVTVVGWKTWRGVRAVRRLHDDRLLPLLEREQERLATTAEAGPLTTAELTMLAIRTAQAQIAKRRKPKRRRLFGVVPLPRR